jgi:hypothetical protein
MTTRASGDPVPSRETATPRPTPRISPQSFEISGGSSETRLCPICAGPIDVLGTGRPPRFCSSSCRNVAAGKRRHARRNLAFAERLRALVAGRPNGYSARGLENQAQYAESHAERLLAEIGEAPTTDGHDATRCQSVGRSSRNPCLALRETHSSGTLEAA